MNDREKVICPSAKFATNRGPHKVVRLCGGEEEQRNERTATNRSGEGYEACDDDERTKMGGNDSEAKTGSGTAFREAAKTRQSRNGEYVI